MEYIAIAFGAIFVNNVILQQFYGLCPFLGVSTKKSSALSMGMAVTFVITLSTIIAFAIYYYVLVPYDIAYLSTIGIYMFDPVIVLTCPGQIYPSILIPSSTSAFIAGGIIL